MKINIQKFQAGGGLLTYKAPPILAPSATPPPAPEEEFDDSFFDKLIGNAVSSDAIAYVNSIKDSFQKYSALPMAFKESPQGKLLRSNIYDKTKLIEMQRNQKDIDLLKEQKKDVMSDFAVKGDNVVVQDNTTGQMQMITADQYGGLYAKEPARYKVLTNREILDVREHNPQFAFNSTLPSVVSSGVSTIKLTEEIRAALQTVGSFSKGTTSTSVVEQQAEEGANGLLSKGMSYATNTEGELVQSNLENIKRATMATWSMLSPEAKSLLKVQAIHAGANPAALDSAAIGIAMGLLMPKETGLNRLTDGATGPKKGPGTTSGKSDLKGEEPFGVQLALLHGDSSARINLITGKSGEGTDFETSTGSTLVGTWKIGIGADKGQEMGENSFGNKIMKEINAYADLQNVSLGQTHIPEENLQALVYKGYEVHVVLLPTKATTDGTIVPDLERAPKIEKAKEAIAKYGTTADASIKADIYQNIGGVKPEELNSEGNIKSTVLTPFIATSGLISSKFIKPDHFNPSVPGERKRYIANFLDKKGNPDTSNLPYWFRTEELLGSPNVVSGVIYIPFRRNAAAQARTAYYGGLKVPESDASLQAQQRTGQGYTGKQTVTQIAPGTDLSSNRFSN